MRLSVLDLVIIISLSTILIATSFWMGKVVMERDFLRMENKLLHTDIQSTISIANAVKGGSK